MLDAVDAGLDGGADALVTMGVGRHPEAPSMGLVGDRRQLLVRVLLGTGGAGVRHDPPRRADLDQLSPVLDLIPDRLAHFAHAVGNPLLHGELHDLWCERLEHRRVEMPTGGRDGVTGGDHAGTVDPPEVDRLPEGDVEEQPPGLDEEAEVPHRREPGP